MVAWHTVEAWAVSHPYRFVLASFLSAKLFVLAAAYWLLGMPEEYVRSLSLAWDGEHYLHIAQSGYGLNKIPNLKNPLAFAPVFPFLIKATGAYDLSPLLVNNVAGIAATVLVTRLMGLRAGFFFALFPTWLAYSSFGYSEGTFVALAAGGLLLLRARRYEWAGVISAYAVATRYTSALAFATLLLPLARSGRRAFWGFVLPGLGVGVVVMFLFQLQGGSFLAYLHAEEGWQAGFVLPTGQIEWLLHNSWTNGAGPESRGLLPSFWLLRNYAFASLAILGFLRLWRRDHDLLLANFSVVVIVLSFCVEGFPAISVPRILLMAFPAIAALGRFVTDRLVWVAYAMMSLVLGTYIVTFQMGGSFFG